MGVPANMLIVSPATASVKAVAFVQRDPDVQAEPLPEGDVNNVCAVRGLGGNAVILTIARTSAMRMRPIGRPRGVMSGCSHRLLPQVSLRMWLPSSRPSPLCRRPGLRSPRCSRATKWLGMGLGELR